MSKIDRAKEIWEEVVRNQRLLDSCSGHEFVQNVTTETWRQRWRCENCQAEVSNTEKYWYELGQKHAIKQTNQTSGGNQND